MLKSILLGGAMLLAIPALAQTTGTTGVAQSGTATTTNDHDPTMDDSDTAAGNVNATVSTQVNGGTTSASTGVGVSTQTNSHQGMNHGAQGTMTHQGMNHGTQGTTTTTHQGMNHGTMSGQTGTTGTTGTTGAYTGVGGPYTPRSYPICSRTITDSCMQAPGRRSRR
jgi:hypothetical protein